MSCDIVNKRHRLSRENLGALITKHYHRIEKGLSLRDSKAWFGAEVVFSLMEGVRVYRDLYGEDSITRISANVLKQYYHANSQKRTENEALRSQLSDFINSNRYSEQRVPGGVKSVSREEIWLAAKKDLSSFFFSRYSIRDFCETEEVGVEIVEKAVQMAQKTPSVCNRQSSRVHVFSSADDKKKILSFQNGNRGFGHQASRILIVTSDLRSFTSPGERNQCWVDGGMYAMSIIYAFHSLGIGTCCLNWNEELEKDKGLRLAAGIEEHEVVIMLIAVGHLQREFKVAESPRKDIKEVLIVKQKNQCR